LACPTIWPPALRNFTLRLIGKSKWLVRRRIKPALHRPTGTRRVARSNGTNT
jgi:hypothetical protein